MQDKELFPPFPKQHQKKPGIEWKLDPAPRFEGADYRAADKLRGKVALVTGGDSGIGRSVAVLFAREGADVAITHLPQETADAQTTCEAVRDQGVRAIAMELDVSQPRACQDRVEECVRTLGRLDILVNNAAFQEHQSSIEDIDDLQLDRTFKTNIYGYFYMVRAALKHLGPGSSIINTGSVTGITGSQGLLDYSATKGAIHAFTKALAKNLVEREIRVNCVAPGPVWTPLNPSDIDAEKVAHFGESTPMGRPAQPEEIAPAFVFFASQADSRYITGQVLPVLGGSIVG